MGYTNNPLVPLNALLVRNRSLTESRMSEAGRKRVEEYFSWEAIADRTIARYQGLVEGRSK